MSTQGLRRPVVFSTVEGTSPRQSWTVFLPLSRVHVTEGLVSFDISLTSVSRMLWTVGSLFDPS